MPTIKPILRIFDYNKAIEFYIGWLGFTKDWEHTFGENSPVYMQVSLNSISIHLSEHHGDGTPGTRIFIEEFTGLKEYHKKLTEKNYKYNKPGLEKAFWDEHVITMEVTDPFNNMLYFTERI